MLTICSGNRLPNTNHGNAQVRNLSLHSQGKLVFRSRFWHQLPSDPQTYWSRYLTRSQHQVNPFNKKWFPQNLPLSTYYCHLQVQHPSTDQAHRQSWWNFIKPRTLRTFPTQTLHRKRKLSQIFRLLTWFRECLGHLHGLDSLRKDKIKTLWCIEKCQNWCQKKLARLLARTHHQTRIRKLNHQPQ